MEDQESNQKSKKKVPQLTSLMIAQALDSPAAHTSFGPLPLAVEKSAPAYTFGAGTRDQLNKVFHSEDLNVPSKVSPGPKYDVHDNINFKMTPQFSIGKDERVTLGKPQHFDHFSIVDVFTDPIRAKNYTQKLYGNVKFGTESRMPPPLVEGTPGPQYHPPIKPEVPIAPAYTLGARRRVKGGSALQNMVSTPGLVGPGRYAPQDSAYPSNHPSSYKWTFGRGDKLGKMTAGVSRHQTYDVRSISCGAQFNSKRKTMPEVRFKTATREQVNNCLLYTSPSPRDS